MVNRGFPRFTDLVDHVDWPAMSRERLAIGSEDRRHYGRPRFRPAAFPHR